MMKLDKEEDIKNDEDDFTFHPCPNTIIPVHASKRSRTKPKVHMKEFNI